MKINLKNLKTGKHTPLVQKRFIPITNLFHLECLIYNGVKEVAKATVNAFQPADAKAYLKEL